MLRRFFDWKLCPNTSFGLLTLHTIYIFRCARSDTSELFRIAEKLKIILHLDVGATVDYKKHQNSIQDGSSFKNAQSFVFAKKVRRSSHTSCSASLCSHVVL